MFTTKTASLIVAALLSSSIPSLFLGQDGSSMVAAAPLPSSFSASLNTYSGHASVIDTVALRKRQDGTFYDGNGAAGACGSPINDGERVCALNAALFDQYTPNGNPNRNSLCGKQIRVSGPKGSTTCTVRDRLPIGGAQDVDMTRPAFGDIADFDAGRVPISWSFVDGTQQGAPRQQEQRQQQPSSNNNQQQQQEQRPQQQPQEQRPQQQQPVRAQESQQQQPANPQSQSGTCTSNASVCTSAGSSPAFQQCDNGKFVQMSCPAGTVCLSGSHGIYCGYSQ
ncbi:hypothetical protein HK102_005745 [Quaeritorhiza haematococci]|nr:hypothetical protein HK102_005745 [Quaeritorhiza haematococci]